MITTSIVALAAMVVITLIGIFAHTATRQQTGHDTHIDYRHMSVKYLDEDDYGQR